MRLHILGPAIILIGVLVVGMAFLTYGEKEHPKGEDLKKWDVMNVLEGDCRLSYNLRARKPDGEVIKDGYLDLEVKPFRGALKVYARYRVGKIAGAAELEGVRKVGFDAVIASLITKHPDAQLEDVKLLLAPVYFLAWQAHFQRTSWGPGSGWFTQDAKPDLYFSVKEKSIFLGREAFGGNLSIGNREALKLLVCPDIPLPVASAYYDPSGLIYECEMTDYGHKPPGLKP